MLLSREIEGIEGTLWAIQGLAVTWNESRDPKTWIKKWLFWAAVMEWYVRIIQ
jgi:hypothetical protein